MKQIKIINVYNLTETLANRDDLSISAKWALYKLRKDLLSHFEFYIEESRNLFSRYETTQEGTTITFKTVEEANDYKAKQKEIDDFEIELVPEKKTLKLSDIPDITISQMEQLEDFIEFDPE